MSDEFSPVVRQLAAIEHDIAQLKTGAAGELLQHPFAVAALRDELRRHSATDQPPADRQRTAALEGRLNKLPGAVANERPQKTHVCQAAREKGRVNMSDVIKFPGDQERAERASFSLCTGLRS